MLWFPHRFYSPVVSLTMEDFEHLLAKSTADGSNIVPGVVVLAVDKKGTLMLPITCVKSYKIQEGTYTRKVQEE
jgi:hypothetical protein